MKTYRIHCLSRALSPITHMAKTQGNEAILNREPVVTPAGVRWIPVLSANAIRHKLVRAPGARFLVERWGLAGKLTLRHLNFLFHGGTLTESTASCDTRGYGAVHRMLPLLRLVGGSLPDTILPGLLIADRGVLVCRENRSRIDAMAPWGTPANLRSAEAFVDGYQYTRGDGRKAQADLLDPAQDYLGGESSLMIMAGQAVVAGACFAHGFILQHVSELEMGALILSLSLWQEDGATVGGQSSRGHGRLETLVAYDPEIDAQACVEAYVAHVDSVRDDAIKWLTDTFDVAARAAKEAKPAKGKKGAAHAGSEDFSSVL